MYTLFNKISNSGSFPKYWAISLIVPVFKKGVADDPNNYRGITLIKLFSKLFASVLNERLKTWVVENENTSDAQFGLKANHSTIDAAFILKYLIDKQLMVKKKLYRAFVDLKKAIDSVSRLSLWYKMIKSGIDGKLLDVIKSLYENIKLQVKCF